MCRSGQRGQAPELRRPAQTAAAEAPRSPSGRSRHQGVVCESDHFQVAAGEVERVLGDVSHINIRKQLETRKLCLQRP